MRGVRWAPAYHLRSILGSDDMGWMGISDLPTFVVAVLVFLAIPGPGTVALLTATARSGVRAGYAACFGLALGDQVLLWLAAGGVAALLAANPMLFRGVQWLGAAYLVWIGVQLLRNRGDGAGMVSLGNGHWFRQGVLITLLNPKAVLFYMAFFPLFIDPARHRGLATFAAMSVLIFVLGLLYCSLLILAGHALRARVARDPRIATWLRRMAGACLIGFGVRLAFN
ncbi:LysE family transporter [Luteimonas sp. 3794]|uniref:LysE family translocator n=1 Tax=Luteimonas sp. 3794 TaxID=2817730 RepID=UPI002860B945|nr:LysE family transporter [Luteimonas sp. 3794]MDR6990328.1 threonine/homoserine/homoserine lactone efflux protein [Luteimonas sp. 3794]